MVPPVGGWCWCWPPRWVCRERTSRRSWQPPATFAISGGYELTATPGWRYATGVCGVVVAGLALYAALASEVDSATRRNLLPMLRPAGGKRAVSGQLADQVTSPGREPGVRRQL